MFPNFNTKAAFHLLISTRQINWIWKKKKKINPTIQSKIKKAKNRKWDAEIYKPLFYCFPESPLRTLKTNKETIRQSKHIE